jgi:soluble lytic murein transglycosylase
MHTNPDWPAQALLENRRQEAIVSDPDDASVLAQCTPAPSIAAALLRCAAATANAGRTDDANALARRAWVETISDAGAEAAFLRRWAGITTPDDQWARFQRLAWGNDAARQITRLTGDRHKAAEARLAAKRDDPQTEALAAALPPDLRDDPGLVLDRARAMRHAGALTQEAALLNGIVPTDHLALFWAERNLLARALVHAGDAKTAYDVAARHGDIEGEPKADAEFLAGFIALRILHDPALAEPWFRALSASPAAITQGRSHYWLARTLAASDRDPRPEYEKSAAWPTTFYGQLAGLALRQAPAQRLDAERDPTWTRDAALAWTQHEVMRAAVWLIAWGDYQRARVFLTQMDSLAPIPAERALTAAFALRAGLPDSAVAIARRMGRDGIALPHLGWPAPFDPAAPPDPAFSLGIMRQESSFDIGAVSSSGALGLMQLMPPTARAVAKQLGVAVSLPALTTDPNQNIRLGTAYLQEVLAQFDGCLPLAAAGYNAGPHRVAQWLADIGDPRTGPIDMVDWIELIPIGETRNYVQRVMENIFVYRARLNEKTPTRAAQWMN